MDIEILKRENERLKQAAETGAKLAKELKRELEEARVLLREVIPLIEYDPDAKLTDRINAITNAK